jgi:aminopeptidase C
MVDIPSEENCAYVATPVAGNETQHPLPTACRQGVTRLQSFEEVRTLAEVVERLKRDVPVIMATRLSENFYINQGLVSFADSHKQTGKLDAHALGHAFLAVGIMELPEKLKASEGNFCILIANSWGKGWGAGGYSCLTEKWLTEFRSRAPFVAVTSVDVI